MKIKLIAVAAVSTLATLLVVGVLTQAKAPSASRAALQNIANTEAETTSKNSDIYRYILGGISDKEMREERKLVCQSEANGSRGDEKAREAVRQLDIEAYLGVENANTNYIAGDVQELLRAQILYDGCSKVGLFNF